MAQYYDSSNLWDDSPNKTDNYSTLGQVLSIGDAFQNANTISDENVQNTILGAKNELSSYEEYLKNLQGSNNLEDAVKFKNNLHFLDLNLTPDLGYDHNPWANIAKSTAQGASAGSIGGPWGAIGGAATGLHMSIGSELGGKRGANASIGSNLGALFLSPLTGGDPLTGGILGGIIGYNWDKSEDDERQKVYNELKAKEQEYQDYANNFANMNIDNAIKRNYRNMMTGMKAFGGVLSTQGGDFSNGLTFINNGGSHEENPYGGIPLGLAPDMQENLVEEGEVVWNDYVFSDRIKVPKDIVNKYKLKGKDMTFARAVEKLQKSAEQRPNDSIEKRGLDATLAQLAQEQETIRQQQAEQDAYNQAEDMAAYAADGGPIHIAKNKRGTFTAAATKHGMGVQEFARKVLANKEDYSPAMVRKANFARNASKWSHALGGYLFADGGFTENPTETAVETPSYYQLSDDFYNMLKEFEGFKSKRYADRGQNSIGYGFRGSNMPLAYIKDINKEMTKEEADEWLPQIVEREIYSKLRNKKGFENLNPYQTEALVSYLYNTGMYGQPKLFKALADNDLEEVARQMNSGEKGAHKERRAKEKEWFNKPYDAEETIATTSSGVINEAVNEAKNIVNSKSMKKSWEGRNYKSASNRNYKRAYAFGGHLFPFGGYFDRFGVWHSIKDAPSISDTYTKNDGLNFSFEPESISKTEFLNKEWRPYTDLQGQAFLPFKYKNFENPFIYKKETPMTKPLVNFEPLSTNVSENSSNTTSDKSNFASYLRYAPVLGSAISSIAAALDSPNRTYSNNLRKSAKTYSNMMQPVSYRPLANYLRYDPLDRMFYANQLEANAAATRSAIAANANANRQAAVNNLLAANYGTNIGLGNLYRQVEEANRDQRAKVAEFNRGTDQYNATAALDAAKTNAAIRQAKANMLWDAAQRANLLDMQEDQLLQASRNQALSGLFSNLGNVGREEWVLETIKKHPDLAFYLTRGGDWGYNGNK